MIKTETDITFDSGDRRLSGKVLVQPSAHNRLAVIAHSYRDSMEAPFCEYAAKVLRENGFSTLRFDFTGHGQSSGGLEQVSFRTLKQDVESATEFFRRTVGNMGIKNPKLVYVGISLGAAASMLSSITPGAQVLVSPMIDEQSLYHRYQQEIEAKQEELARLGYVELTSLSDRGQFKMGKEWIEEAQERRVGLQAKYEATKVPTFVFYGTKDDLVCAELIDSVSKRNRGIFTQSIRGADHDFTEARHREELMKDFVIPWLEGWV